MNYALYKVITRSQREVLFDTATGTGSDSTIDPGPKRDPNNFLAPIFGNELFTVLASIAAVLIVTILILVSLRMLKNQL